jgi:hypothetical protein
MGSPFDKAFACIATVGMLGVEASMCRGKILGLGTLFLVCSGKTLILTLSERNGKYSQIYSIILKGEKS